MRLRTRTKSRSIADDISSASSSSNGDSSSQEVSSDGGSTSQHEQDVSSQIGTQRKTRGRTMWKDRFSIPDPEKRIRLELNKYGQPVGESATKLASLCGVVARISTLCPITYNDWRHLRKDMKEPILSYMKERAILSSHKEIKNVLRTIGHLWNSHKTRLRQNMYKAYGKGQSKSEIHGSVPFGVDVAQWIQFVDYWLTEEAIARSNKHKAIRQLQKNSNTTGSKSYARKRKEMEDARDREVGAIEFYRETHMDKNGQMKDDAWDVWEKCNALLGMVSPQDNEDIMSSSDRIHLEKEVMLEVQGPEHGGRVRGAGRGPTPAIWFDSETLALHEKAKTKNLTKRNAELERREAEREKHAAELVARNAELEKREAELVARNAKLEKRKAEWEQHAAELMARNAELEKREAEREQREAERDVEFSKLKQVLEAFMRR